MMVKKYDREKLGRLILAQISKGINTNAQIARKLKTASSTTAAVINNMCDANQLFKTKIGRVYYYSTFQAQPAAPAHDPFGLCHAKTNRSNDEVSSSD